MAYHTLYDYLLEIVKSSGIESVDQLSDKLRQKCLDLFDLEADSYMIGEMTQEIERPLSTTLLRFINNPVGENIGSAQKQLTDHFWKNVKHEIQSILDQAIQDLKEEDLKLGFRSEQEEHQHFHNQAVNF